MMYSCNGVRSWYWYTVGLCDKNDEVVIFVTNKYYDHMFNGHLRIYVQYLRIKIMITISFLSYKFVFNETTILLFFFFILSFLSKWTWENITIADILNFVVCAFVSFG